MAERQVANAVQARRWNGDTGRRWVVQRERHAAVRQRLMPYLLRAAAVRPGDRVLEVGCGCGELAVALGRAAGPGGSVLGLDLSGPVLAVARRLAAEAGAGRVRFVRGDAQVHRLPVAAYDVVVSGFGVMFFDDPAAAFGNLLGALRPAGRLAFLCWVRACISSGLAKARAVRALPVRFRHADPGLRLAQAGTAKPGRLQQDNQRLRVRLATATRARARTT